MTNFLESLQSYLKKESLLAKSVLAKLFGYGKNFTRFCEINSFTRLESSSSKYRKNTCLDSCIL